MKKDKTIYYATREKAQAVIETLPPFKASRFSNGVAKYKIASSNSKCNFMNNGLGGRDMRASRASTAKSKLSEMTYKIGRAHV